MTLDTRLAQAIADAGAPAVTVFAVRLARIGYAMAVEDAKRELAFRAALCRDIGRPKAFILAEEIDACAETVGRLKP